MGGLVNLVVSQMVPIARIGSFAIAISFAFSVEYVLTPILGRVVAAGDTYLIRDESESSRVQVLKLDET
jgi:hypothetical protein